MLGRCPFHYDKTPSLVVSPESNLWNCLGACQTGGSVIDWEIGKIINVANELACTGSSAGSTGEVIAAAFVLNRMEFIPHGYSVIEAWERLDERWQGYVK